MNEALVGGIVIAVLLAAMAVSMFKEARNAVEIAAALVVAWVAVAIVFLAVTATPGSTWKQLDYDKCAQYEWVGGNWECIPWEEAG